MQFLHGHDERAWAQAVQGLLPAVHEVDRSATQIWFAFHPLALRRALDAAGDPAALAQKLRLQGDYSLEDRIDTSHAFLYGHRFWPEIKRATAEHARGAGANGTSLVEHIRAAARKVAAQLRAEESLLVGITAVAFMTLEQVGLRAFEAAPGEVRLDRRLLRRTPEQVLRERARDDGQGLFGFLRTTDKRWTVVWNEADETARFQVLRDQEVASAAAADKRDFTRLDPRCTIGEGPIPVQCRSASCGTCWVGVVGGAEKLSAVTPRERKAMQLFGYVDTDEPRPLIRLSCQAQAQGAVSIVIPPWNGVYGKQLRRRDEEAGESARAESAAVQ